MSRMKLVDELIERLGWQTSAYKMDTELCIDTQVEINKELLRLVRSLSEEVAELKASRWQNEQKPSGPRKRQKSAEQPKGICT